LAEQWRRRKPDDWDQLQMQKKLKSSITRRGKNHREATPAIALSDLFPFAKSTRADNELEAAAAAENAAENAATGASNTLGQQPDLVQQQPQPQPQPQPPPRKRRKVALATPAAAAAAAAAAAVPPVWPHSEATVTDVVPGMPFQTEAQATGVFQKFFRNALHTPDVALLGAESNGGGSAVLPTTATLRAFTRLASVAPALAHRVTQPHSAESGGDSGELGAAAAASLVDESAAFLAVRSRFLRLFFWPAVLAHHPEWNVPVDEAEGADQA
jgi:hypothetical protein